jgi:glycosyltransferase involved in cell wall biosynthesis
MSDAPVRLPDLFINGRFLMRPQTGVERFAQEVIRSIDALISEPPYSMLRNHAMLVTPIGVKVPSCLTNIGHIGTGLFRGGYAWEQFDLPRATSRGVLLNLCNLGPVFRRRQVVVVHDALVRARPDSYSLAYRAAHAILVPRLMRHAAQVITVSDFSREEISRWYEFPATRLSVCHEGAEHILAHPSDRSVLNRAGVVPGEYLLAVGVGATHKNLGLLLRAFSLAQLDRVKLVLTGGRSQRVHGGPEPLLPDGVVHLGRVTDGELRALYESALALVHPSDYEGFGLPVVEAMICGCPVMTTHQGALMEVANGASYRIDFSSPDSLAVDLRHIASDTELRRDLIKLGLERASGFTWRRTAERILRDSLAATQ